MFFSDKTVLIILYSFIQAVSYRQWSERHLNNTYLYCFEWLRYRSCLNFFFIKLKVFTMKLAQEIRTGNVIMLNGNPMVVQKAEYSKSGRNAAVVKMKLKNLLSNGGTETVFRADDRLDDVILEHKDCTYSYYGDPLYVFMDEEFNQYEIEKDNMGDVLNYLIDGMEDVCQVTFYNGKAISVELPITIVREVEYTEPAVKGDTSGKVVKPARLAGTGYVISVPDFVNIGDKIEIDTRTNEFKKRV